EESWKDEPENEESWKRDHDEVQRILWRFEDNLAVGLALFKVIHDRYWTWRDRVIRGIEAYDVKCERSFRERFVWWLRTCEGVTKTLDRLESKYGSVEGGRDFRRHFQEALQILEKWESPKPPTTVAAHT